MSGRTFAGSASYALALLLGFVLGSLIFICLAVAAVLPASLRAYAVCVAVGVGGCLAMALLAKHVIGNERP